MTITTLDGYIAAAKQRVLYAKTSVRTTIANGWFSLFDLVGLPGAGTLAGVNTAAGVVPDATVAGYPTLNAFGGGNAGVLARAEFASTVAGRLSLYDRLFVAGAYAFNAVTSLAAQPSYSARVPGGTDFSGLQIWIEAVTAFTGNLSVAVTYANAAGVTGRTTGTFLTGTALTVGRCMLLPLQAGDVGVQKIESVTATVATAGTFNVMVLRSLDSMRVPLANFGDVHDLLKTGMPIAFATSALYVLCNADSTSSGVPEMAFDLANG